MPCAPLLSFLSIDMGTDELQDQLKAAGASETEGAALAAAEVAFAALYDKAVAWRKAQGDGGPLCGAFVCIAMHEKVAMHAGRRQTFLSPAEAAEAIDILVKDLATQTGKGWEKALEVWQPPAKALACWPIIAAVREASAPPPLFLGPTVPRLPMRPLACTLRLRLKRRWRHAPSRSDGSPWRAISFLFALFLSLRCFRSFLSSPSQAAVRLKALIRGIFDEAASSFYFTASAPPSPKGRIYCDTPQAELCWPLGKASLLALAPPEADGGALVQTATDTTA